MFAKGPGQWASCPLLSSYQEQLSRSLASDRSALTSSSQQSMAPVSLLSHFSDEEIEAQRGQVTCPSQDKAPISLPFHQPLSPRLHLPCRFAFTKVRSPHPQPRGACRLRRAKCLSMGALLMKADNSPVREAPRSASKGDSQTPCAVLFLCRAPAHHR